MRQACATLIATALCLLPLGAPAQGPGTPAMEPAAIDCLPAPQALDEERFVRLGGIEQWITIKGRSCANPVVLFLHGGPGNTLSP